MVLLLFACAPSFLPARPARMGQRPACLRCGVRLLEEPTPEEQERQESGKEPQDFSEDFDAGVAFGQSIKQRFVAPTIDDPGLPYADVLVVTCGTLFVASVVIAGGLPRPSWLVPLQLVPQWRALPYVLPTLSHGASLAACWLLGALAAEAFEKGAYMGTWRDAVARTWRGGAFAIGVLIFGTQLVTSARLAAGGVPIPSYMADLLLTSTTNEVIVDCAVSAVGLTLFRLFRWWDAQTFGR